MAEVELPKVSFVIPTLNAGGILGNCLQSIRRQDYPQDKMEILLGDGGSKDNTRDLARQFGAVVIDDHGRHMEGGKRAALVHVTGEYVVFVDADNEIAHSDFIRRAVDALSKNSEACGVESYYLYSPRMSSLCAYLTCVLHISDPIAWLMSVKPVFLRADGDVEHWTFPQSSLAYPIGANGFVFRKSELDLAGAGEKYSDTHTSLKLIQATGKREWLRIRGRGVYHYYIASRGFWATLRDFVKKRQRATAHFFDMRDQHGFSWTERKPRIPGWLAVLLCLTIIVPVLQTIAALARTRDTRWLWHPLACILSAWGVITGTWMYIRRGKKENLVQRLQPTQKLEDEIPAKDDSLKR
ncbi:MAG TPA: glycosyltransferase family 2 protein [Verrucomicrobiae bacterium]|jgi:glycosyltransferase involved in cell wall biosynthesis|nr:glycosyltransferase family 2 protein [Verrucomicrobiae bacterium]